MDVTIVDATGNKTEEASVPDDAAAGRILARLIELMQLPMAGPTAAKISNGRQPNFSCINCMPWRTIPPAVPRQPACMMHNARVTGSNAITGTQSAKLRSSGNSSSCVAAASKSGNICLGLAPASR